MMKRHCSLNSFQKSAFSLIELLVVVAIIAVLAAIALPIYTRYRITAGLIAIGVQMQGVMDQSINFAQTHGRYGNAYDLGFTTSSTCTSTMVLGTSPNGACQITNISNIGPNFSTAAGAAANRLGDNSMGSNPGPGLSSACGAVGDFALVINPTAVGLPASMNYTTMEIRWWNYNGTIYKVFMYTVNSSSNVADPTQYLPPPWININSTTSATFDRYLSNTQLFSATPPNMGAANCLK